ncbi:MAG: hypothetical protein O3C28_15730 [Proteobacteria bacterium]|nr:hypothetical protein [Pseudomonadota bacterium]
MYLFRTFVSIPFDQFLKMLVLLSVGISLIACSKPDFVKHMPSFREPEVVAAPVAPVDSQLTPRELLTARLVNPPANSDSPRITVGKLIEFADRYLSCDCSGQRFVKSWERRADDYQLTTNSEFVRPLTLACQSAGESTDCFLAEIDRGPQVADLQARFVPGSQFIQFIYDNGLQCEREGPCQAQDDGS